jgi:hypothetical protein
MKDLSTGAWSAIGMALFLVGLSFTGMDVVQYGQSSMLDDLMVGFGISIILLSYLIRRENDKKKKIHWIWWFLAGSIVGLTIYSMRRHKERGERYNLWGTKKEWSVFLLIVMISIALLLYLW